MKNRFLTCLLVAGCLAARAQVSISDTAFQPHPSAILDVRSTSRGVLIPRLTTAQRTGLSGMAKGLMVYDSTLNSLWYYNGSGWGELSPAATWLTSGNNLHNSNSGNVGIGTASPLQKLDVAGNLALTGKLTLSNLSDGWLRLNQAGDYTNGIYSPGFLRIDGGITSGAAGSSGAGTVSATTSMFTPILYDYNNSGYYLDPASTTNLNVLRWNTVDCLNGTCPPNNAIRMTPNLHLNSGTGYAVIVNWDNGTTGPIQTFRIGNGAGSDVFYVKADGSTTCAGDLLVGTPFAATGARMTVKHYSSLSSPTLLLYENSTSFARLQFQNSTGNKYWHVAGVIDDANDANSRLNFYHSVTGDILSITGDGKVGIGTTVPTQRLTVNGNICATGTIAACSDVRYKTHILPLAGALGSVLHLHPIYYQWRQDLLDEGFTADRQIGFSAQEVEQYFPEMVQTDSRGYKAVDYSRMTPVLVAAVKEEEQQLQERDREIAVLQAQLAEERKDIETLQREMAALRKGK